MTIYKNTKTNKRSSFVKKYSEFVKKWGNKVFLSILDQGLFSGTNFLINILLARWLSPEEYGAFSVTFSIYLFFASVLNALTLEPMLIFGSSRYLHNINSYLKKILQSHIVLSIIISGFLIFISLFLKGSLKQTFISATFGLPFLLVIWYYRRAFYIKSNIANSVILSTIYFLASLIGIFILLYMGYLHSHTIYFVFIFSGILCAIYFGYCKKREISNDLVEIDNPKEIYLDHWNYGKWIILASIASSISSLLYIPLLGLIASLEEAAAFKSIQNLILPFQQVLTALSLLIIPWISKKAYNEGISSNKFQVRNLIVLYLIFSIIYSGLIIFFGKPIINLLYSNPFYSNFTWLIPFFAFVMTVMSVSQPIAISLRALRKPNKILISKVYGAITVVIIGAITISNFKLAGILLCMILSVIIEFVILLKSLLKELK